MDNKTKDLEGFVLPLQVFDFFLWFFSSTRPNSKAIKAIYTSSLQATARLFDLLYNLFSLCLPE
jgi:hypothetical protein